MPGPLKGVRIIEIGSIGPGPFAATMLADHGADVIRIDRPGIPTDPRDVTARSREVITLDLKTPEGVQALRDVARNADGLIEGFRPGVMEKLGIGPDILLTDNPRLVYGRMTGWGQTGPYAPYAGHDLNYIALTGALHAMGEPDRPPTPPLNLVGDFGGGGMLLAFSMTAAIMHARQMGEGQVIDCAMAEGAAMLAAPLYYMLGINFWQETRGGNLLDGGAPFYSVYETADGKYIAIGSIEPQFYTLLLERLGLREDPSFAQQNDKQQWPEQKRILKALFLTRTRQQWCELMEHSDICFAPVLSFSEAPQHPQNIERNAFVTLEGIVQPAPTPRYSVTQLDAPYRPLFADRT